MKSKILFSLLLFSLICFANDSIYKGDGITVYPVKSSNIQMVAEVVYITEGVGLGWQVEVVATFRNYGPAETVQIGFPFRAYTPGFEFDPDSMDIEDYPVKPKFHAYVDGIEVPSAPKIGIKNPELDILYDLVYTFNVHFAKDETKMIRHLYTVGGNMSSSGDEEFTYVLKTGSLWKGNIESVAIIVELSKKAASKIDYIWPKEHNVIEKSNTLLLTWKFKNIKPDFDLEIGKLSFVNQQWKSLDTLLVYYEKFPYIYKKKGVYRYLKNAIFALYGYPFKNQFVNSQFYLEMTSDMWGNKEYRFKENPLFKISDIPEKYQKYIELFAKKEQEMQL